MSTFEIVRGVEGYCLVLDGTRICGPKPWGGGRTVDTFRTDGIYEVIDKDEYRKLLDDNAKLREQMERLVTLLRADCDIEASWDGLRKFWSIGLTENGCLMRDRACKAEAENAKLRELVRDMAECMDDSQPRCKKCKFRELNCQWFKFDDRMRELGVEVD